MAKANTSTPPRQRDAGDFLTPCELGELLKLEEHAVYRFLNSGEIPGVRFGRSWRIPRRALEALVDDQIAATKKGAATTHTPEPNSLRPPQTKGPHDFNS